MGAIYQGKQGDVVRLLVLLGEDRGRFQGAVIEGVPYFQQGNEVVGMKAGYQRLLLPVKVGTSGGSLSAKGV